MESLGCVSPLDVEDVDSAIFAVLLLFIYKFIIYIIYNCYELKANRSCALILLCRFTEILLFPLLTHENREIGSRIEI